MSYLEEVLNSLSGTPKVMFEAGYKLGLKMGKTENEAVEYGINEVRVFENIMKKDFNENWINLVNGKRSKENY